MWKCFGCGHPGAGQAGALCSACNGDTYDSYMDTSDQEYAAPRLSQHNVVVNTANRPLFSFNRRRPEVEERPGALERLSSGIFKLSIALATLFSVAAVGCFVSLLCWVVFRVFTYETG